MKLDFDLHPYDGTDRRFRDSDADTTKGRRIVAFLLRLPAPPPLEGLRYDLNFYSGGIGVLDRLAISIVASAVDVDAMKLTAEVDEDIDHLTDGDLRAFVDENRAEFQPPADGDIWFTMHSNVNDWGVVWRSRRHLHYVGYSQG